MQELRSAVRAVCDRFPDAYWRDLDARREYPEAFVAAMTEAGFLGALIPAEYGGMGLDIAHTSVILEEINASGGNAQPAHAQVYTMGTLLRHGSEAQKREYLPKIASGELRLQAFGVTEPEAGTDTTSLRTTATRRGDSYVVNGRKMYISRVQHSDAMVLLARTGEPQPRKSDGLSVFLVDLHAAIGHGLTVNPRRVMINNVTNELVFERPRDPRERAAGGGGRGLPLHPRRHERRADPDRRRVHRQRPLVRRAGVAAGDASARSSAARSAPTRASSSRSRAPTSTSRPPT